ncbi:MAG TPA: hypothetical protein VGP72_05345 [Planctomycetota bacterium]|jgi:hypothetical protein
MKPRLGFAAAIAVSAYAPLALLFAIRDFDEKQDCFKNSVFVYSAFTVAVASGVLLFAAMSCCRGQFLITTKRVSLRSNDLAAYSIPYVVSFFSVDFGKWQDISALLMFLGILLVLAIRTQSIFLNPFLALLGWGLYEVEFEESGKPRTGIFLSKIELAQGKEYKMERLSPFLYIVPTGEKAQ